MTGPKLRVRSLMALAMTAIATPDALAEVRQVGPGRPYGTIFDAVAASNDGDTLLVAPGTYGHFGLIDKGLSIVAEGPGVRVTGSVRIMGLAASQSALVSGLEITNSNAFSYDAGINVANCEGPVRIQECDVDPLWYATAISVRASDDVAIARCDLKGGEGYPDMLFCLISCVHWYTGGGGLGVVDSVVTVERSSLRGSTGGIHWPEHSFPWNVPGNPALYVGAGARVIVRGSVLVGGDSAWYHPLLSGNFGETSPGVSAVYVAATGELVSLDSQMTSGQNPPTLPNHFVPNVDLSNGGTWTPLPGNAPSSSVERLLREGQDAHFHFEQEPLTRVDLLVSSFDAHTWVPALSGSLLVAPPYLRYRFVAGYTDASGALDWTWTAPQLPLLESIDLRWQSAQVGQGTTTFGALHVMTVLDSAY